MKNLISSIFLTLICAANGCAQEKPAPIKFTIGYYQIEPETKSVLRMQGIHGEDWDGFQFVKDKKINFDTTTLVLAEKEVWFKEYFPFPFDVNSLKLIYSGGSEIVFEDQNALYYFHNNLQNLPEHHISLKGFTRVADFIYKKNDGKLYYLSMVNGVSLEPVDVNIDTATVQHILGNYYYDKNGLYVFGYHSFPGETYVQVDKGETLAKSKGNEKVVVKDRYFIYGDKVYGNSQNDQVHLLDIDPQKMYITPMKNQQSEFITDGKSLYEDANGYSTTSKNSSYLVNEFLGIGVNIEKILTPNLRFYENEKKPSEVELISEDLKKDAYSVPPSNLIAKVNNQWYLLYAEDHDKKPIKITKFSIHNSETKKVEPIDDSQLTTFNTSGFIRYKNTLYFDGYVVNTAGGDLQNLREIPNSGYFTDGKMLLYVGNITGVSLQNVGGKEMITFEQEIIKNAYSPDLKVIADNVLTDGVYLISGNQRIKIADLKLKTKIFTKS